MSRNPSRPPAWRLRAVVVALAALAASGVTPRAFAALSATAEVFTHFQYLGDPVPTLFVFNVTNTGSPETIGSVAITRPGPGWTVTSCSGPWPVHAKLGDGAGCAYTSAPGESDNIADGASRVFFLKATVAPGPGNRAGAFAVNVSAADTRPLESGVAAAPASPHALRVVAYALQLTDAVISTSAPAPGSPCPLPKAQAPPGSSRDIVVCGLNRSTATATPDASASSLGGTFPGTPGTFSSGPIAPGSSVPVVLGAWIGTTVSGAGVGKTVAPRVGASPAISSPRTAFHDYAAADPLAGVTAVSGAGGHTCAVLSDGSARCWGSNSDGRLGDGSTASSSLPVRVSGLAGAVDVAAGDFHTCAVLSDGSARCWGYGLDGQLGDGSTDISLVPVKVKGLTGATAIATGRAHSCALLSDGSVRCWGGNYDGQLGDGSQTESPVPVKVRGLTGAVAITAGGDHTCVLLSDGSARCWGYNYSGQLGDGSTASSSVPVAVSGLSGAVGIAAGYIDTCAVLSDGSARCWGYNLYGQLGDGSTASSSVPVAVAGLSGAVAPFVGFNHSCALLSDGSARCWGLNGSGQLGDGSYAQSPSPVAVSGLSGAVDAAAGWDHGCVVLASAEAECWGQNLFGSLGDGSEVGRLTPVTVVELP